MQENFGINGMLFEVSTVMASIENDEPTPHVEVVPIEGYLVGYPFIIGEFKFTDIVYENGDGQVKCSIAFTDKTKDENDELISQHANLLNTIVTTLISNSMKDVGQDVQEDII